MAQRARSAGRGDRQSAPAAQTAPATERLKAAQLGEGMAEREAEAGSVRASFRGVRAPFRGVRVAFRGVRALEITVFGRRLKPVIEAIGLFVGAGGGPLMMALMPSSKSLILTGLASNRIQLQLQNVLRRGVKVAHLCRAR